MSKDLGDVITGIYNHLIKDKVIHDGVVTKSPFQIDDVITGSVSGASATIDYVGNNHFTYTLNTDLKLKVNDVITGSLSGATCTIPVINQLHTTISDRIYFQEAIEDELVNLFPYIVFSINAPDSFLYYTGEYETIALSIMAFSEQSSSTQITAINKQLNDLINKKSKIVMSNWDFKGITRKSLPTLFRDANKIWNFEMIYDFIVQ